MRTGLPTPVQREIERMFHSFFTAGPKIILVNDANNLPFLRLFVNSFSCFIGLTDNSLFPIFKLTFRDGFDTLNPLLAGKMLLLISCPLMREDYGGGGALGFSSHSPSPLAGEEEGFIF